jgi:putative transposase
MAQEVMSLIDTEPPKRFRFDYKGMHRYVITLAVFGGKKIFASHETVSSVLNCLRDAAQRQRFEVYAYCFLPDRLELIVRGKDQDSDMKKFLAEFRASSSSVGEKTLGHALWKRKYRERVLRKTEETRRTVERVLHLPVLAGLVRLPSEYPFAGSFVAIR